MWHSISRWIIQKILLKIIIQLGTYLPVVIKDWKRKKQREIEQEEAKKQLQEALKKPDMTPEEMAKEYAKYQNSGR